MRDEIMESLSSDTGTVIDGTAGIREGRYERAALCITPTSTIQHAADIPVDNTAAHTTATAPTEDFQPTPTAPTTSISLLSIPSNIYILVEFMPIHLGPKLGRGRPQMGGGVWI